MQTASYLDPNPLGQPTQAGLWVTGSDENRQPVSSVATVFSAAASARVFLPRLLIDKLVVAGQPPAVSFGIGRTGSWVRTDSESALLRAGVSRRIHPVDVLVAATTRATPIRANANK